jgi:hypothetical protein
MSFQVNQGSGSLTTLATLLLNEILATGTSFTGVSASITGDPRSFGTFTGDPFGFGSGIVLSTGQADDVLGPNLSENVGFDLNPPVPPAEDPTVFDESVLTITFNTAAAGKAYFAYVFGSEEFVEEVGKGFSDKFELLINGTNIAKTTDGKFINVDDTFASPDFINNTGGVASNETELDGYTKPLFFEGDINSGQNVITIRIKDEGDNKFDSAVFIKGKSLGDSKPTLPTPPPAPTDLDLIAASDDGASDSDNITSLGKPVISGKGIAGNKVKLFSDVDEFVGEAIVGNDGTWSITASVANSNLLPGKHSFTAQQTDLVTNLTSESSLSLSIRAALADATVYASGDDVPVLSAPTLEGGGTKASDTTPVFTGTSTVLGATIELFDSTGTMIGTGRVLRDGKWTVESTRTFTSGSNGFKVGIITPLGVTGTTRSSETTILILNTSTISGLGSTDTGRSSSDGITKNSTPTLSGTAEAGSKVRIFNKADNATAIAEVTTGDDGKWSYTFTTLAAGTLEVYTQAQNAGTNEFDTPSGNYAIKTDYTKPVKPAAPNLADDSDNGVINDDNETTRRKPTLSGTAEAGSIIHIFDGGTEVATTTADTNGTWNYTFRTKLTQTPHSFTITAEDVAGNVSDPSDSIAVVVATPPAPPTNIDMIALDDKGTSDTDNITKVPNPTFTGTAGVGLTVELYDETGALIGSGIVDGFGNWSITSTKTLPDGGRTIKAIAIDTVKGYRSDDDEDIVQPTLNITIDTVSKAPTGLDLKDADDSGISSTDNITKVTEPEFSGNAEPGSTVTLFSDLEGTTAIGTATADANGKWTIKSATLRKGKHKITAKAADIAGNDISVDSSALEVEIDTENPVSAPTDLDLTTATDTGASSTDNITGDNTPDFTGKAEAGSTVKLTSDKDGDIGTAVANANGDWTITASKNLQSGIHAITAIAQDIAGNSSTASTALNVTIVPAPAAPAAPDLDAPSDSGVNTDNLTNIDEPDFVGSGLTPGSTVTLMDDADGVLGTAIVDSTGKWTIKSKKLRVGKQKVKATVTDPTGTATSAPSPALDIEIDTATTKPVITKISDATNSASKTDSLTNQTTVGLEGTAEANSTVVIKNSSNTTLGTATTDATGKWSLSVTPAVTGTIDVTASATDVAGNTIDSAGNPAVSDLFNFEIDTTKPNAPIAPDMTTATDTGTNTSDDITSNAQPTFTSSGVTAGETVKLFSDGVLIGSVVSADGTWSIPSNTALTVGDRVITATTTDAAGNESLPSTELPITIVGAPLAPSAPNLTVADDSGVPADNITKVLEPNVTGTSTAPDGSTITLFDGTDEIGTGTITSGKWTVKLKPKRTGKQKIKAQVTNVAGGTSPFSAETEIDIDSSTPAPVISDLVAASDSATKGDKITNVLEPDLTGTAEPSSKVELFDENNLSLGIGTADGTGKWTIKAKPNRKGKIKIKAVATDIAGNINKTTADTEITIDDSALAPTVPDLTAATDTGVNNDDTTSNTQPDFTGTAEPGSTVKLSSDKDGLIGTAIANITTGAWTITSTKVLQAGPHDITAKIDTDVAGNLSPASAALKIRILGAPGTVTVDLSTPSDSKGDSDTDNITNVKTPTFSGIADANSSIKLFAKTGSGAPVQVGTGNANAQGDWTIAVASNLADGVYQVTAEATEPAAGTTKTSTVLDVTIDTIAPDAPLVPDLEPTSDSGLEIDDITNIDEPFFVITAEPGTTVTLFSDLEGADPIGTGKADGTGKVRIKSKKIRSGNHKIKAKTTDIAGNASGFSPELAVTVSTTGAAVTIDSLSEDSGISTTDRLTNDNTPKFDGVTAAGATVELTLTPVGGTAIVLGTVKADATGKWTYTVADAAALEDADYSLVAKATDLASNVSSSTPFTFTIDRSLPGLPTVDLTDASDSGASNTDNETFIRKPTFAGTSDLGTTVEVFAGTTLLGTATTDATGKWTLPTTTDLALGNYDITAKAKNRAGTVGGVSPKLPVKIVNGPPDVTLAMDKATVTEVEGTATITATLSNTFAQAVTINLGFTGTATNGTDYRPSATAIVVAPGQTSGSITLKTIKDAVPDKDEVILVDVLTVTNGVEATPQQVRTTIKENAIPVAVSLDGTKNLIMPGMSSLVKGLSATDSDGTIAAYQITLLPAADQGTLFLGSSGGRVVTAGQRLSLTDIGTLTFRASDGFTETRFTYAAIDNLGDLSNPATVTLVSDGDPDENGTCGKGKVFNGKTKNDKFKGGGRQDRIKGGNGNDRLSGGGCNDLVIGGNGNDRLGGDSGMDTLLGGNGNDRLDGGSGLDTLNGATGNDVLLGRAGNDRLKGGVGKDRLLGGTGNDRLRGNRQNDRIRGEAGNDILNGGVDDDVLSGGTGNDVLVGRTGKDRMRGGSGDDLLNGGLGKDTMNGGLGRDRFLYNRMNEKGDQINGFTVSDDVIDLKKILGTKAVGNPKAFQDFIKLSRRGTGTIVKVDTNGSAAGGLQTLAIVGGVPTSALTASNFVLS